jgi:hypothetical protein
MQLQTDRQTDRQTPTPPPHAHTSPSSMGREKIELPARSSVWSLRCSPIDSGIEVKKFLRASRYLPCVDEYDEYPN